jgi:hypothetical protein
VVLQAIALEAWQASGLSQDIIADLHAFNESNFVRVFRIVMWVNTQYCRMSNPNPSTYYVSRLSCKAETERPIVANKIAADLNFMILHYLLVKKFTLPF